MGAFATAGQVGQNGYTQRVCIEALDSLVAESLLYPPNLSGRKLVDRTDIPHGQDILAIDDTEITGRIIHVCHTTPKTQGETSWLWTYKAAFSEKPTDYFSNLGKLVTRQHDDAVVGIVFISDPENGLYHLVPTSNHAIEYFQRSYLELNTAAERPIFRYGQPVDDIPRKCLVGRFPEL